MKCKECGLKFEPKRKTQTFCSRKCARLGNLKIAKHSLQNKNINWSEIHKRAYRLGRNFVAGGTTPWLKYKDIKVQGSFELRMCYILDKMKDLSIIQNWEYTNDRYQYVDVDGKRRTYLLDFKIFVNDGFYYIETKGFKTETDIKKWQAVRDLGFRLDVLFEKDLVKLEKILVNN